MNYKVSAFGTIEKPSLTSLLVKSALFGVTLKDARAREFLKTLTIKENY